MAVIDLPPASTRTRQLRRVSTGSVTATSTAEITVTWTTAFADTNYTVSVSAMEDTVAGTNTLTIRRLRDVQAGSVKVVVANSDLISRTGTLHVTAEHD